MLNNWNILFWQYDFLNPNWFWTFLLIPFIIFFINKSERKRKSDFNYSGLTSTQNSIGSKWIWFWRKIVIASFTLVPILVIFALAKPFNWQIEDINDRYKYGIDIIIAMDVSESMLANDFEPNRLEASKKMAVQFVSGRKGDRIGLVLYGSKAYTACPATVDYETLIDQIEAITPNPRLMAKTAIGVGLGTAVTRLREDTNSGKVIILLTDGRSNAGDILPETAAELAKSKNIKVYTIGIGSEQYGQLNSQKSFDENSLKNIAKITGGKYFRAKDNRSLQEIYLEIDKLEKREIKDLILNEAPPAHPEAFINWSIVLLFFGFINSMIFFQLNE